MSMDFVITSDDQAILETTPQIVKRYLCFRPRFEFGRAIVDGEPTFSSDNQSIIEFHYRDFTGSLTTDLFAFSVDETIEIGTSPGKRDVGLFRLRKPVDTLNFKIFVNETSFGDVPISDGMYITFLHDRLIWEKKIHRLPVGIADFIEYTD